jgi:hypothetical protein
MVFSMRLIVSCKKVHIFDNTLFGSCIVYTSVFADACTPIGALVLRATAPVDTLTRDSCGALKFAVAFGAALSSQTARHTALGKAVASIGALARSALAAVETLAANEYNHACLAVGADTLVTAGAAISASRSSACTGCERWYRERCQ